MKPLIGLKPLLTSSFDTFKENWKNFVTMALLPGAASLILGVVIGAVALGGTAFYMFSGSSGNTAGGMMMLVALVLIAVFVALIAWFQLAMMKMALPEGKIEVKPALEETKSLIWPYIIVGVMMFVLIMLGVIALVIPGIIAAVWFSFASIIFLEEGKRGMDALRASRELVRDYFWAVAGRLFVIGFLIGFVSSFLSTLFGGDSESTQQLVSALISLVTTPVAAIYLVYLYRDLKRVKGEAA